MANSEKDFDCRNCPSPDPNMRFNPLFPDYCSYGPAGSIKLLGGNVCPCLLGVEKIRRRCTNFDDATVEENADPLTVPCLADQTWQEKETTGRKTCMVENLPDLHLCYGYKPRN